ncbi:hypothetical protein ACD591_05435 [Rufibacter glacialis]|uniref:PhoD-like phosphatase metallophosphatase domain-containing protein n=1 Tax=Rufibacter glacialis TaxID=1259555 RepID=A0A5M8QFH5_9BACT|nr:hypothetical protein [Rufibacter glacialis]KAA6434787.1 hypothetical protein FOE74_11490 [Rufibacter glacialis]GGK72427.1 hypothetical protein GCM10011405_20830 [Rufibacter glacialis]
MEVGEDGVTTTATLIETTKNEAPTVQFGKNLWIAVVTAEIGAVSLQAGKIYSYNLLIDDKQEVAVKGNLRTEGFLTDADTPVPQKALGYKSNILPSFAIPAEKPQDLFIAQASCRKMHGQGDDALAYLDSVLESYSKETSPQIKNRPQQLLLTGDQIYADDVAGILLRFAGTQGDTSRVGEETIAIRVDTTSKTEELSAEHVTFPPYLRQHVINTYAGFTSGAAGCHLMSFEEFAGVYLNSWSLRSWNEDFYRRINEILKEPTKAKIASVAKDLLEGTGTLDDPNFLSLMKDVDNLMGEAKKYVYHEKLTEILKGSPSSEKYTKWLDKIKNTLERELKEVANFAKVLPQVSRVMANVPCYMIFDDHEITDDWNLTQRWRNQVYSKPLGRDIIRNGLMAYAVFQDWGNVPSEYKAIEETGEDTTTLTERTRFLRLTAEYCDRVATQTGLDTLRSEVIGPMETLLGMGSEASKVKWHYNFPTGPVQTYVLNTRTSREYPSLNASPGLIPADELKLQLPEVLPNPEAPFVMVVSPVPVLGLASFEELIQPAAAAVVGIKDSEGSEVGVIAGEIEFDLESWAFNVPAFERLIERLNTYKKVLLLSGDVHFGSTAVLDYWKGTDAAPSGRILQLTSSASKNAWMENLAFFKSAIIQKIFTGIGADLEKVGWKGKVLSVTGKVSIRNRHRLRQDLAVIPTAGWQTGAKVNVEPDYRWRLRFLADERERPDEHIKTDIIPTNQESLKTGYQKVVQRHQDTFISGVSRRLIWPSNVSKITFEEDGTSWKVHHEFFFRKGNRKPAERTVGAHIKHVASLKAMGDETKRPQLV